MGSICDHKYIVYGSTDSPEEQYRLSTPSISAKLLLLFFVKIITKTTTLQKYDQYKQLLDTKLRQDVSQGSYDNVIQDYHAGSTRGELCTKYKLSYLKLKIILRDEQSSKIPTVDIAVNKGKKCELDEESENLKGLFERELTIYNNKKQCMKMNNKRYEERFQELLEEKESAAEIKKVQVECTSKTMSLELQLEEMHKTLDQRDKCITKQTSIGLLEAGLQCILGTLYSSL
ncbi:hypothetical protein PROFUN_15076 [Planoprotostelium fungivorum]|uniref:Uncharacterized protein n=1 Tax=Planoprotostelium fungivorum TaxID=1890364 RepID=A0A2P6MTC2_9EUKA|nr:hypothetical protein PROFUN_15076 [Planoprotostelium fungivorum]